MNGLSRWMVRLYPREWRERYEEEFLEMLEERTVSFPGCLDIALGALDAWMRPQIVSSGGMTRMLERLRWSVLGVLWGWVLFVLAGVGFQKMTEYDDFVQVAQRNFLVRSAFDAIVAGAWLSFAAILIGGLPIVFVALKSAFTQRRREVMLLFLVPPLSLGAFVGYVLLLTRIVYPAEGRMTIHSSPNIALFSSIVAVFVLAAVASTAAVCRAVTHAAVGENLYRFAFYPAVLAAGAMCVGLISVVVWGVALKVQAPALFGGDGGILATSTAATWLSVVLGMALSTGLAAVAIIRGFSPRAASRTTDT